MAKGTFEEFIDKERARLNNARDEALAKRDSIDREIAEIDRELYAIAAYEEAKLGKPKKVATTRGPRAGGRRDAILALISQSPAGIGRADILEKMGLKGDKRGEQSVSNALSALKKTNKVTAENGLYKAT